MNLRWILIPLLSAALTGCMQTYEAAEYDRDAYSYSEEDPQASSLIEVNFGGGDPEVTKNVPADAADALGDAVRSVREGKKQP